jgi:gas vesicle protein
VVVFGLAVGLVLAYLVAMQPDPNTGEHYYAQIMVPGALVGVLVGWATARYGAPSPSAA